jgi:hypothetical protein
MNGNEASWFLALEGLGDALLAAVLGVVWTSARNILKSLDERIEARQKSARKPGDPTS